MMGPTHPEFGGPAHAAALACAIDLTVETIRLEARTVLDTSADLTSMTFIVDRVGAHTPAAPPEPLLRIGDETPATSAQTPDGGPYRIDRMAVNAPPHSFRPRPPNERGAVPRRCAVCARRSDRPRTTGWLALRLLGVEPTAGSGRHLPRSHVIARYVPAAESSNPHARNGLPVLQAGQRKPVGRLCR